MSIFLSGGPILEPMIGAVCASISCLGIIAFILYKYFRSEHYQQTKTWDIYKKITYIVLSLSILFVALLIIWYLLTFIFTGIVFSVLK